MRETEGRKLREQKSKTKEKQKLCKFANNNHHEVFTFDQEEQPSRSLQPMMQTIHDKVLTISLSCPITMCSRGVVVVCCCCVSIHDEVLNPRLTKKQLSIHHEVLTCCCCCCCCSPTIHHEELKIYCTGGFETLTSVGIKLPITVQHTK